MALGIARPGASHYDFVEYPYGTILRSKNDTVWTQTTRTLQARRQQGAAAVASKTSIDCPDGIGTLCISRWLRGLSRGFTSCVLFLPVHLGKRSTGSEPIVLHI